jgi:D-sedoheptulose 7-phosphate isomerase
LGHGRGDICVVIGWRSTASVLTSEARPRSGVLTRETAARSEDLLSDAIQRHIDQVRSALARIPSDAVRHVVDAILRAQAGRRHVYVLGNGGSAATASHFACDLSKATVASPHSRLRVTALNDNVALLTAWANDTEYELIFAEPLRNLLDPGDLVIAISASGNSRNVLEAVRVARSMGAVTVGLTGFDGGRLVAAVDLALVADSSEYGVVEDCHLVFQHAVIAATRAALEAPSPR